MELSSRFTVLGSALGVGRLFCLCSLTRAKKVAMVVGSAEVLRASLLVKVERGGQLSSRLEREL